MATVKLATLFIRTVAKPISAQLKHQATQHPRFREICVSLAQRLYRTEVKLRTNVLGEPARHIRPLSETKAIENGANALAEGFLFSVAALLIVGEAWRTSRNSSKRRDDVDDQLDDLKTQVQEIGVRMEEFARGWEERFEAEKLRHDELARILERVVEIGLRGGWAEFQDTPLRIPQVQLAPFPHHSNTTFEPPPDPSNSKPDTPNPPSP